VTLLTHLAIPAAIFLGLAWRARAAGREEIGLLVDALRGPSRAIRRAA
jgi:hypothetical protein